eukprot:CAMPEP_0196577346 /NCGR_PEP_ID=MMETSP1081-20130531/6423_1 /TAXON_ID=36882 /ORGANISM="Pyramimonas amylifera, Strain CCMP720" /LENGTH=175 /DNA_ID=CAMNT_0041896239 /DNA_START=90 /DNA_END=614 /DNA_ORIENTATION=+
MFWFSSFFSREKSGLSLQETEQLVSNSPFTREEILRLHSKYRHLDVNGDNSLSYEELKFLGELRANPLAHRICLLFSEGDSGHLSFQNFVDMMAVFSYRTPPEIKLIWAFAIWDFDGDDVIGPEDIKYGLDQIVNYQDDFCKEVETKKQLEDEMTLHELDEVVQITLGEIDPDGW